MGRENTQVRSLVSSGMPFSNLAWVVIVVHDMLQLKQKHMRSFLVQLSQEIIIELALQIRKEIIWEFGVFLEVNLPWTEGGP